MVFGAGQLQPKRRKGKGRKVGKAEKARVVAAAAAVEDGSIEAEVEVKDWSQQKRANQARTDGSIKKVNPSPCDLEARAEVVHRGACDEP